MSSLNEYGYAQFHAPNRDMATAFTNQTSMAPFILIYRFGFEFIQHNSMYHIQEMVS